MANLKKELVSIDKKFYKSDKILGKNILTMTNRMNSSRGLMFSSQLDQLVTLLNPEPPRVYTNYEQIVAKYSSSVYKTESDMIIIKKISKFKDHPDSHYILLVYNVKDNVYDIIHRKAGEIMTETYGYKNDNTNIDALSEGDKVYKEDVLYHSTSFDEDMVFGYGINGIVYYTTDPMTIEDGIVISESFAKRLISIEYDSVRVPLNDNDILINLYGDRKTYKGIPDIGEDIKDATIAVKRRITYSQSLYDLKEENMQRILSTDTPYYIPFSKDKIVDVDVYCNKEIDEIPDTVYNKQLKKYLQDSIDYHTEIVSELKPIIDGGNHTDELSGVYSRSKRILDPEIKWKDQNDNVFSNIILDILVEKEVGAVIGSKISTSVLTLNSSNCRDSLKF